MNQITTDARTVADLFGDLAHETSTLVRQEVKLAQTEMADKAKYAGTQAAVMAASALVAGLSLFWFIAAIVFAIGEVLPYWAAALIVGGGLAVIAAGLAFVGYTALKDFDAKPKKTVRELEETTSWMRTQVQQ